MIRTDSHIHTHFSADSQADVRGMAEQGIRLGLTSMCFTDHMDLEYPERYRDFTFDQTARWEEMKNVQAEYRDRIDIRVGIELGLQPHLKDGCDEVLAACPYDFVIGSTHLIGDWDPYYREEHPEYTAEQVVRMYLQTTLDNLNAYDNIHAAGHLDYIVRYVEGQFAGYEEALYRDLTEQILRLVIEKGLALEVNTSGYRYEHGTTHPHPEILKRYRELGGEMLTIGSDAHTTEQIGAGFCQAEEIIRDAGFDTYVIFRNGKPEFISL